MVAAVQAVIALLDVRPDVAAAAVAVGTEAEAEELTVVRRDLAEHKLQEEMEELHAAVVRILPHPDRMVHLVMAERVERLVAITKRQIIPVAQAE